MTPNLFSNRRGRGLLGAFTRTVPIWEYPHPGFHDMVILISIKYGVNMTVGY